MAVSTLGKFLQHHTRSVSTWGYQDNPVSFQLDAHQVQKCPSYQKTVLEIPDGASAHTGDTFMSWKCVCIRSGHKRAHDIRARLNVNLASASTTPSRTYSLMMAPARAGLSSPMQSPCGTQCPLLSRRAAESLNSVPEPADRRSGMPRSPLNMDVGTPGPGPRSMLGMLGRCHGQLPQASDLPVTKGSGQQDAGSMSGHAPM